MGIKEIITKTGQTGVPSRKGNAVFSRCLVPCLLSYSEL